MEDFIASFDQMTTMKKIGVVSGVSILLLFFVTVMFFITNPKQKSSAAASETSENGTVQKQPNSSGASLPIPSPTDLVDQYSYVGNHFQIIYRSGVYSVTGNKNNGEDHIILQSDKVSDILVPYFIDIQVSSSQSLPLANLSNIFESVKYLRTTMILDGNEVIKYQGAVDKGNNTFRDTVVIFEKNDFTYKIQLSYISPKEESEVESNFEQLLENFKVI